MPKKRKDDLSTVVDHYEGADEKNRLLHGTGQLEFVRTCDIIHRFAPAPPAVVLDVGGGAGVYALWLAELGYEVHIVDPVRKHLAQAEKVSAASAYPLASIHLGDARTLAWPDDSADMVLLLGPLYHLTERNDRVQALGEAVRVLRPGGRVFAAAISRFASAVDGLFSNYICDPEFQRIVARDLATGQHRNPANHPGYFTTAYFHHPDQLAEEFTLAGLKHECTLAVEGVGCLLDNFDTRWTDACFRRHLLDILRRVEAELTMLGASSHLLAIGRK